MKRTNEGIIRLVEELVEQLESYQENVLDPSAEKQPHYIGDDHFDIALSCRKAKKLLAMHAREENFENECEEAFKEIVRQRNKLGLGLMQKGEFSRNVTSEELSEVMALVDKLGNLLRKAIWNWQRLTNM